MNALVSALGLGPDIVDWIKERVAGVSSEKLVREDRERHAFIVARAKAKFLE
jgi:hypothetical protein